jgi:flagellar hook-associated protein 1 FlgK
MYATLEELSGYVEFNTTYQADGSVTVLIAGQTPLVTGDKSYELGFSRVGFANGTASASINAADGTDITGTLTNGSLGALLTFRNRVLGGIIGGPGEPGDLNRLAQAMADRVNTVLTEGRLNDGPPPATGVALFSYDNLTGTNIAASLTVDLTVPSDLAAIDPEPPYVSNGIPLRLAALAEPDDPNDKLDGMSFTEFFGAISARVGRQLNDAKSAEQTQSTLVAQAKDLRQQSSGVSLDEEATILIQFQRSYQAMARVLKTLDELTQEAIGILK